MPPVAALPLASAKSRTALASVWVIAKPGMVTPGIEGVSAPAMLLAMMTAIAPAAAALLPLIANEQVPRRITAIAPANVPAAYAAQPSSTPLMPALMRTGVVK